MAYPEKNAEYRHKPAWLNRATEAEKTSTTPFKQRAEGGAADDDSRDELCGRVEKD